MPGFNRERSGDDTVDAPKGAKGKRRVSSSETGASGAVGKPASKKASKMAKKSAERAAPRKPKKG